MLKIRLLLTLKFHSYVFFQKEDLAVLENMCRALEEHYIKPRIKEVIELKHQSIFTNIKYINYIVIYINQSNIYQHRHQSDTFNYNEIYT